MSRLDKLMGKPMQTEIGGEMFTIEPLTCGDMDLLMRLDDVKTRNDALKEMIHAVIKKAEPEATDAEINGMSMEHTKSFINAIMTVNGMKPEELEGEQKAA